MVQQSDSVICIYIYIYVYIYIKDPGVSTVAQWVKNLTSIHEEAGLIPGLTRVG